ncbi:uncharacterized protein LOC132734456 [Ruditapes philippinarum]|uniref:uncharacterized protein LOC132734456 n=1 Tax=Ruditapes philippinarum TaxID=129788 RepID=UPI00295B4E53|nr:uncharacterized protein LOC132734456 [Ruditapes philippinarum]
MALSRINSIGLFCSQLLILLYPFVLCNISYTTVEIDTLEPQNVTPCFSFNGYKILVLNESLSWTEAEYSCKKLGFKGLIFINQNWRQWVSVREVIQRAGFPENITFWTGHFRPYFHIKEWYRLKGNGCEQSHDSIVITGDIKQFHQCAGVQWETYTQSQRHVAKNCSEMLPYICYNNADPAYWSLYVNFATGQNLSGAYLVLNDSINTFNDCMHTCTEHHACLSFTFNYNSSNCTMFNILSGFGMVTYEVEPGFENITHGVKTGCNISVSDTPGNISVTNVDPNLPNCGLSPIPSNYCQLFYTMESNSSFDGKVEDQIVNELISNLSVDIKSTSSYIRKHTSASDSRASATFFGTVGAIVLTVVISLPVIADSMTLYFYRKLQQNIKSKKKNRKLYKDSRNLRLRCHSTNLFA